MSHAFYYALDTGGKCLPLFSAAILASYRRLAERRAAAVLETWDKAMKDYRHCVVGHTHKVPPEVKEASGYEVREVAPGILGGFITGPRLPVPILYKRCPVGGPPTLVESPFVSAMRDNYRRLEARRAAAFERRNDQLIPEGYRRLIDGEQIEKGDLYLNPCKSWTPVYDTIGKLWNPRHYPTIRFQIRRGVSAKDLTH